MINKELLDILVCPESRTRLQVADEELLGRVNAAISAGTLVNRAGQTVTQACDGGLVREDGQVLYPVVEEIPILLVDEGIPLDQLR